MVGIDSIAYVGNHGLEQLAPSSQQVELAPELEAIRAQGGGVRRRRLLGAELRDLGVELEDKRSIQSFHWRGASDEPAARRALEQVAERQASRAWLPHWGRKVLEIRPPLPIDKGTAVAALLRDSELAAAVFIGDDTTDLDAFRALRELRETGVLDHAVCVGVLSPEGPRRARARGRHDGGGHERSGELLERLAAGA